MMLKSVRSCRNATRLVLLAEERSLSLRERLTLRLHLRICATCPRFVGQVRLMRGAMDLWRRYAQHDEPLA